MNKIKRCPACKRTLQQALDEQLGNQKVCPLVDCAFKTEIRQAFLESEILIDESDDNLHFVSKYCNQCGKPYNSSTSIFCSYCGKKRNK